MNAPDCLTACREEEQRVGELLPPASNCLIDSIRLSKMAAVFQAPYVKPQWCNQCWAGMGEDVDELCYWAQC